jgi:hypothetical protein
MLLAVAVSAEVRIPLNSATDSERNRPAIPEQSGRV